VFAAERGAEADLKARQTLIRSIVSIKNQIHGLLLGYGLEITRSSDPAPEAADQPSPDAAGFF